MFNRERESRERKGKMEYFVVDDCKKGELQFAIHNRSISFYDLPKEDVKALRGYLNKWLKDNG